MANAIDIKELLRILRALDPKAADELQTQHFPQLFAVQLNIPTPTGVTIEQMKQILEEMFYFCEILQIERMK